MGRHTRCDVFYTVGPDKAPAWGRPGTKVQCTRLAHDQGDHEFDPWSHPTARAKSERVAAEVHARVNAVVGEA
jgi:hypothetical protein